MAAVPDCFADQAFTEMEDSQEILFNSLRNSGAPIPLGVSSIQDLRPATLFSICSHSLSLIDKTSSFPTSLPEDSMADRVKICSDLASAFRCLGFIGDISFHKFLYPSEEDLYKLVRFLVGRLAESSEVRKASDGKEINEEVILQFEDLKLQTRAADSIDTNSGDDFIREFKESHSNLRKLESDGDDGVEKSRAIMGDSDRQGLSAQGIGQGSIGKVDVAKRNSSGNEEIIGLHKHKQKLTSLQEHLPEGKPLMESTARTSGMRHLQEEHELLKAAVEMAFDDQNDIDFYIQDLNNVAEARRNNLVKLESQWNAVKMPLEEKRRSLLEAAFAMDPVALEKLQKKKEIEQESQSVFAEIKRRESEFSALSAELEKQPKVESRQSFVQRIKETSKNSRKQEADIERILKDTRELQLESNSIQERLNRTYALVNETVLREARKDPVGRKAYRMLTRIHKCFEQTAETILATDRTRREVSDYEAKLSTMASRSLNIDKLQTDLDAIRTENDILELKLNV